MDGLIYVDGEQMNCWSPARTAKQTLSASSSVALLPPAPVETTSHHKEAPQEEGNLSADAQLLSRAQAEP